MTDTTDIKALREKLWDLDEAHDLRQLGDDIIDQLEAERQRLELVRKQRDNELRANTQLEAELAALKPDVLVMPDNLHRDTKALLLIFASAMAVKLHKAEQNYGYSNTWMQSDWQDKCLTDFNHHIGKGDPLDVANYCAFMHYHGWPTALKGEQVPVALVDERQGSRGFCLTQHGQKLKLPHDTELFTAPQKLIDLPYDVLFNAIAKSATPLGEHMSISVKDFKAAIEAAGGIVKDGE